MCKDIKPRGGRFVKRILKNFCARRVSSRVMKIYTRTGDDGTTGMLGGARILKSDARIDCTGDIDEVNAALGWAGVVSNETLAPQLRLIQSDLFVIGSHLSSAATSKSAASLPPLEQTMVQRLEEEIDSAEAH